MTEKIPENLSSGADPNSNASARGATNMANRVRRWKRFAKIKSETEIVALIESYGTKLKQRPGDD